MEELEMFYTYFVNAHGVKVAENINLMIFSKVKSLKRQLGNYMSSEKFSKIYIMYIFDIAILDYFGLNNEEITEHLESVLSNKIVSEVSVKKTKKIHNDAIQQIKHCLKQTFIKFREVLADG